MNSVLNVEVSCFANYNTPNNPRPINLLTWLTSAKYRAQVEAIRAVADKAGQNRIKATLPAITPSGLFARRANTALVQHSGLICLDVDLTGNKYIKNYSDLKQEFRKLRNVAYGGLSVSGTGYFLIIPIAYPERHLQHFQELQREFFKRWKIKLDKACSDVARLRGYSYDEAGFFRHDAAPFKGLYVEPEAAPQQKRTSATHSPNVPGPAVSEATILRRCIALVGGAVDGEKDRTVYKAALLAGGYIATGALDEDTAVGCLEDAVSRLPNVASFTHAQRTIQNGIRDGKLRPLYLEQDTYPPNAARPVNSGWQGGKTYIGGLPLTTIQNAPISDPDTAPEDGNAPLVESSVEPFVDAPLIVKTLDECAAKPGSILRPDPSQVEYPTTPCPNAPVDYPANWNTSTSEPTTTHTDPKAVPCVSAKAFHEWQRTHPAFSWMGLNSLKR